MPGVKAAGSFQSDLSDAKRASESQMLAVSWQLMGNSKSDPLTVLIFNTTEQERAGKGEQLVTFRQSEHLLMAMPSFGWSAAAFQPLPPTCPVSLTTSVFENIALFQNG